MTVKRETERAREWELANHELMWKLCDRSKYSLQDARDISRSAYATARLREELTALRDETCRACRNGLEHDLAGCYSHAIRARLSTLESEEKE